MTSKLKVEQIAHTNNVSAMTINSSGYITTGQPVLAHLTMTSNQTNLTEQTVSYTHLTLPTK